MYWGTVPNMSHREQTRQWNGAGDNPWHVPGHNLANDPNSTNKANGCESCHQPHNAATSGSRILKQDGEAGVCLVCHNGNVSYWNIDAAMNKTYAHPSKNPAYDGRHNPKRMPDGTVREDPADLANRHAECEDCHNPHAVSPGVSPSIPNPTNNLAAPVNKGVWGVQPTWPGLWANVTTYTVVPDVQYQYQLCLKCHSYYAFGLTPPQDPYGQMGGTNQLTDLAKEFNPNNASFHPVVTQGKNPFTSYRGSYAGSLLHGLTPNSTFTCSECHSDSDPVLPGLKGPHGADVWPIIWGPYDGSTGKDGTEGDLCFKCHDANVYMMGTSVNNPEKTGFSGSGGRAAQNLHAVHVGAREMPCLACHSAVPHGWKRKALLIYGRTLASDPGADPAPYNAHYRFLINGSTDYGIPSSANVDSKSSGQWSKPDCHGGIGVGQCGTRTRTRW